MLKTLKEIHDKWLEKDVQKLICSDSIENENTRSI